MTVPKVSKHIIDDVLIAKHFDRLASLALLVAGLVLIRAFCNYFQGYIFEYTSQKVIYLLRDQIYTKLQYQSFEYFDKASTGAIMNRWWGI